MVTYPPRPPRPHRDSLEAFLDTSGRVSRWPSRTLPRDRVLEYLNDHIDANRIYSEMEMNILLDAWHSFNDAALLRRALFDSGRLARNPDGSGYRRIVA